MMDIVKTGNIMDLVNFKKKMEIYYMKVFLKILNIMVKVYYIIIIKKYMKVNLKIMNIMVKE